MKRFVITMLAVLAAGQAFTAEPISVTAVNSMVRIPQDGVFAGENRAVISAAKNEWESFQIAVAATGANITVLNLTVSDLENAEGGAIGGDSIRLYREEYVRVRRSTPRAELPPGLFAGPLVPFVNPLTGRPIEPRSEYRERWGAPIQRKGYEMYALPFDVFRGQTQPVWVDIHVPADTPAGIYEGVVTVTYGEGGRAELPVMLTVWDFTLPGGPSMRNHFGNFRNIAASFPVERNSEAFRAIERRYCEMMAEHRINPPLPRDLLPETGPDGAIVADPSRTEALAQFMESLHVTDFEIPRAPFPDPLGEGRDKTIRYIASYHAYVMENGWADRAYYYMHDEPNLAENYELVREYGRLVHETAPGLRCLVVEQTYPQDPSWPDIDPAVDIWCPLWSFIDEASIAQKIAGGDEVWSYTALVQRSPRYHPDYDHVRDFDPPYWHIDRPLAVYRLPVWINRRYGINGLLYWSTVTTVLDPWNNPAFSHFGRHFNGGGFLFYPGTPCGIDGPVADIRLKNLRDGMEDYEYFVILEKLGGKEAVDTIVRSVARTWWDYTGDPGEYMRARERLAHEIVGRQ